jgi:hypothetical protein
MPLVLVLVVDEHAVPLGLLGRGDEMADYPPPGREASSAVPAAPTEMSNTHAGYPLKLGGLPGVRR